MILASGVYLPTDKGRSILVFGGTGSGKYYYYIEPNLMQCNTSFVVSDPGGDLYRRYGKFLEKKGYKVKSLNLNLPRMDKVIAMRISSALSKHFSLTHHRLKISRTSPAEEKRKHRY